MSAAAGATVSATRPPDRPAASAEALPLDPCLARLDAAIDAARSIGLPVADAESVRSDAAARLGFGGDAFVVALVGGTGVGKSSLLNALAGADVSAASVRRPTTSTPVAWLPRHAQDALRPVLEWLGIPKKATRLHDGRRHAVDVGDVAIVDLPDLDSVEPGHRARVEEILPRIDAVIWVTDPEKYHDALLHDEFLGRWLPRLGRQLVVVNKADRLKGDDGERLRRDLERDVGRLVGGDGGRVNGAAVPRVVLASALAERGRASRVAGRDDPLAAVRGWLAEGVDTKHVVRARLIATIRATIDGLAGAAGAPPTADLQPVLAADARRRATDRAGDGLLRVVDLDAARRQAIAATRARARARGAGPLGGLTSRIYRWSGRQSRVADPAAYLARWRDRGTAGPAAGAIRAELTTALRTATPATRRVLANATAQETLERSLTAAVDRAIATDPGEPPTSRWWTLIGIAQTVATAALVLSAIWVGLWIVIRFPADSVALPLIGRVPAPFVALVISLAVGYLLARLLGLHAGWLGRRWAAALASRLRSGVKAEVEASAFAAVDRLEDARQDLWQAARDARKDCAAG